MKIFLPWLLHYNRPNPRKRRSQDIAQEAAEAEDQILTQITLARALEALSPLEQRIAELVAQGRSEAAIANELQISRKVVRRLKQDLRHHLQPLQADWGWA